MTTKTILTLEEAAARAARIWPDRRIDAIYVRTDGDGFDVALNVLEAPVGLATAATRFWYHQLNGDGHAVCHQDCADLERLRGGER